MTQTILTLILLALITGLLFCAIQIVKLLKRIEAKLGVIALATGETRDEIRTLRLTSRARVSQVGFGESPIKGDEGITFVRSGRASRSRRVVVGGDASSEQHRNLTEHWEADNERDVSSE